MATTKSKISESFSLTAQLLSKRWKELIGVLLVTVIAVFPFEDQMGQLGMGQEMLRLIYQFSLAIWSLSIGFLLFMLFSWSIPTVRPLNRPAFHPEPFKEPYLNAFAGETLRMAARIILWACGSAIVALVVFAIAGGLNQLTSADQETQKALLGSAATMIAALTFLLPVFYKYIRLSLVPFIALFCGPYRDDKVDALKVSAELTKRPLFWWIGGLYLLTTVLSVVTELGPKFSPLLHSLPLRTLFLCLGLLISAWSYSFMYLLFEKASEEKTWT